MPTLLRVEPALRPVERPYSVSVTGIVVDAADRVLIVRRRDNGRWEPPGGVLEPDETVEQGVVREVREETGVTVTVGELSGVYQNLPRRIIALVYRCRPLNGVATPTAEASEVRWAQRSAIDHLMLPAYAVRVHDAFTATPTTRAHDGQTLCP